MHLFYMKFQIMIFESVYGHKYCAYNFRNYKNILLKYLFHGCNFENDSFGCFKINILDNLFVYIKHCLQFIIIFIIFKLFRFLSPLFKNYILGDPTIKIYCNYCNALNFYEFI